MSSRSKEDYNVDEILDRIMQPKEILDPRIFDYKEEMLPEVRDGLLKIAEPIIEKVLKPVHGLEVYDICLNGSAASYFYHEKSDMDMRIEVRNKNCSYVSKNPRLLNKFMGALMGGFHRTNFVKRLNGRFVDVKVACEPFEIVGLYSILNNKWRVYPSPNIYSKFSKSEILNLYYERKAKIGADILEFRKTLTSEEYVNRVSAYYTEQFDLYANFKSYLVFKLLSKTGVLRKIGKTSVRSRRKYLSLYTQEELERMEAFHKSPADNAAFDYEDAHSENMDSADAHSKDSISL